MSDNPLVNTNTAAEGATNIAVAADDVGGVLYQVFKLALGADGVANLLASGAGAVNSGTPRVTHASDDPAVTALASILAKIIAAPATEAKQDTANTALASILTSVDGLEGLVGTTNTQVGGLTETAPASDTASSGLNGRLQRVAQRITSLIALLPASLGSKAAASSLAVTQSTEDAAQLGALTETAPASDTASSGLNGRLQRIAQRVTSLIALIPASLATGGGLRVTVQDTAGTSLDYTLPALVEGGTAHDAAMSTRKPVAIGGLAKTGLPTAVSDGDISHIMVDRMGRVISRAVLEENLSDVRVTLTATGALLTADANNKNRIYGLILANTGANALTVDLKDDTTARASWQIPAGETRGFMVPSDAGLAQAAVNKAWNLSLTGTSPGLTATALYVKAGI